MKVVGQNSFSGARAKRQRRSVKKEPLPRTKTEKIQWITTLLKKKGHQYPCKGKLMLENKLTIGEEKKEG